MVGACMRCSVGENASLWCRLPFIGTASLNVLFWSAMPRPNRIRDLIDRRLNYMRKRHPTGYAQLVMQPFSMPPAYAQDDDDDPWWTSQEAKDFAESIKKTNWE